MEKHATHVLLALIAANVACATAEIVLPWSSIEITSSKMGGLHVLAQLGEDEQLRRLEVRIRGESIEIPAGCREGLRNPFLNRMSTSYGRWSSGESYWTVEIPYDGTNSVELDSYMAFVLSSRELLWSYKSVQLDERTWEETDICGPKSAMPPDKAVQLTLDPAAFFAGAERTPPQAQLSLVVNQHADPSTCSGSGAGKRGVLADLNGLRMGGYRCSQAVSS